MLTGADSGRRYRFAQYDPDLVVSVHPLMQHIPIRVLKRRIRKGLMDPINFATVVTDFTTCSNLWFHRGTTKCFVPTDFAAERARCDPSYPCRPTPRAHDAHLAGGRGLASDPAARSPRAGITATGAAAV